MGLYCDFERYIASISSRDIPLVSGMMKKLKMPTEVEIIEYIKNVPCIPILSKNVGTILVLST